MTTVYIDSDFHCHVDYAEGRRAFEIDYFNGMPKPYIEGFIYVPSGETWVREDGTAFQGEMICPVKPYTDVVIDVATSYLNDEQAETVTILFEEWQTDTDYKAGDRRQYKGLLYRCVQDHRSQDDWTPDKTPALWVRTSTDPWPEWVQPTGAHDAYSKGFHVSHKGKHWESDIDNNVYEPGVYGWSEVP